MQLAGIHYFHIDWNQCSSIVLPNFQPRLLIRLNLITSESELKYQKLEQRHSVLPNRKWCHPLFVLWAREKYFSNSLIIHALMTQSDCFNSVRCMDLDTQWDTSDVSSKTDQDTDLDTWILISNLNYHAINYSLPYFKKLFATWKLQFCKAPSWNAALNKHINT